MWRIWRMYGVRREKGKERTGFRNWFVRLGSTATPSEWIVHLAALLLVQLFMVKKCIDRESLPLRMIYAPLQIAACPLWERPTRALIKSFRPFDRNSTVFRRWSSTITWTKVVENVGRVLCSAHHPRLRDLWTVVFRVFVNYVYGVLILFRFIIKLLS